jgi:hypothetical protein
MDAFARSVAVPQRLQGIALSCTAIFTFALIGCSTNIEGYDHTPRLPSYAQMATSPWIEGASWIVLCERTEITGSMFELEQFYNKVGNEIPKEVFCTSKR